MAQQFDFLQLSVNEIGGIITLEQGDKNVQLTVHQLHGLIKALQQIHATECSRFGKMMADQIKKDLGMPAGLRPVKNDPKGGA